MILFPSCNRDPWSPAVQFVGVYHSLTVMLWVGLLSFSSLFFECTSSNCWSSYAAYTSRRTIVSWVVQTAWPPYAILIMRQNGSLPNWSRWLLLHWWWCTRRQSLLQTRLFVNRRGVLLSTSSKTRCRDRLPPPSAVWNQQGSIFPQSGPASAWPAISVRACMACVPSGLAWRFLPWD